MIIEPITKIVPASDLSDIHADALSYQLNRRNLIAGAAAFTAMAAIPEESEASWATVLQGVAALARGLRDIFTLIEAGKLLKTVINWFDEPKLTDVQDKMREHYELHRETIAGYILVAAAPVRIKLPPHHHHRHNNTNTIKGHVAAKVIHRKRTIDRAKLPIQCEAHEYAAFAMISDKLELRRIYDVHMRHVAGERYGYDHAKLKT